MQIYRAYQFKQILGRYDFMMLSVCEWKWMNK